MEGGEGRFSEWLAMHCPIAPSSSPLSYAVDDIRGNNHYWLNGGHCLCLPTCLPGIRRAIRSGFPLSQVAT